METEKSSEGKNQKEEPTFEFYRSDDVGHYSRTGELRKSRRTVMEGIAGLLHSAAAIDRWLNNTPMSAFTPGVVVAEQILTAHAAELAMKHLLRLKERRYDKIHDLDKLYDLFTNEEKCIIEKEYKNCRQNSSTFPGWETVEAVFSKCSKASVDWRFNMIEGKELDAVIPSFLRDAAISVLSLQFPRGYLTLDPRSRKVRQSLQEIFEVKDKMFWRGYDV